MDVSFHLRLEFCPSETFSPSDSFQLKLSSLNTTFQYLWPFWYLMNIYIWEYGDNIIGAINFLLNNYVCKDSWNPVSLNN